ncbi:hypothetical protein MNBD_IGNAVI01-942 [hydrothermal vent metagenome]|uniref:Carbohydrate-binding family V/XII n=1 Tax=hydrothermal vent metagenome TaxID=652676 RepID=A0A3B1CD73_9ZZZZ
MKRISFFIFALLLSQTVISAQDDNEQLTWPREFTVKKFLITVYQPQLESFKKNILEGRIAVSIKPENKDILFCAAWFKATMDTDLDERIVTLEKMKITKVHFPDYNNQEMIDKLSRVLEKEFEAWNITMSLDRLTASLDEVEDLKTKSETLNNAPPDIYFRTIPSSLISIDGDPIMKDIKDSGLEYVVNTAFFIVREKGKSTYYIKGGKFWYQSDNVTSNWKATEKVPKDIMKLAEENIEATKPDSISASITEPPALIVVTKPSELIQTDGEPDYQSIENTSLLYVKNTESDIIMDINSQEHFVLLAGRWYQSKTLADGDWKFTEPDKLPEDFSKIPDSSDMGNVRASIPGTMEAQDALLEQSIPQTAAVSRDSATVEVKYDGNPEFKKIEGTEVAYAVNTDKQVLRISGKYYCVDNAIWFVSDNATGPWKVSDVRPDEVDDIPPSAEVYNVKYVYVYDSTPSVVYVGYYPGYTYSYVYGGVVVYGTGYHYHPWYGHYYYPRPVTWGFGVHYNPWTGWGFSVGFSYGWVSWRFHPYRGWWGPRGYHHGYRHGYHRGYHHGYRRGAYAGYRAGYRAGQRNPNRNIYRNPRTGVKTSNRQRNKQAVSNRKARPSTKPNNIYTDRKGDVYQRGKDGKWSQKQNRKTVQPSTREKSTRKPSNKSSVQRNNQNNLNRSYQNRNRGNTNYNKSRPSNRSYNRGGGRSGGGRRR